MIRQRPGACASPAPDDTVGATVRRLFGRDSLYLLVWGTQLFLAAALTPVVTRVLGTAEFGEVTAAIAVMQVLFAVAGFGLQTGIQRYYALRGPGDAARLLTLSVVLAALVTVVADRTGDVWSRWLGLSGYSGTVRLAVWWAGASAVTYCALGLLRSQDRLLLFSAAGLAQSVLAEVASLVMVLALRPTPPMFLLGRLLGQLLALAVALVGARPRWLAPRHWGLALSALGYSLPLVPAELSTFVLNTADRLIVGGEMGLTAVARYQIAYNVGGVPLLLIHVLNVAWMPRIFALDGAAHQAAVLAASRDALYRLLEPVLVGLALGLPVLLRIWAPARYQPDDLLPVAGVVLISVVPFGAGLAVTRGLLVTGHTGAVAGATVVGAVANVACNLALVPRFGLVGSAASTFASFLVLHTVLRLRARKTAPLPGPGAVRLLRVSLAAAAALALCAAPTGPEALVVRMILAVGTLAWFVRLVRRLSDPQVARAGHE
ncbi:lipopolysaccharide biosynthesis protein [Actinoplanes sp. NPDC049681]|uniref:lipopolysaccharide biosynthesis protein n=1 Tax=Actinoplanes sp. NPDC049681 TaxID=3363905 RepID=UPI0037A7EE38